MSLVLGKWQFGGVDITLYAKTEHIHPDCFALSGSERSFAVQGWGDVGPWWGWFCAEVRIFIPGTSVNASAYLSGVSERSFNAFLVSSKFNDLVTRAFLKLYEELQTVGRFV